MQAVGNCKRVVGQSTIPKTTSSIPGHNNQKDTLQFIGPAKTEFKSFLEFALYSLENYWHNWRNYESPQSYIIPPVFEFKNPDKSDQDIQSEKAGASFLRKSIDRFSDAGEHQIFDMISHLAQIDSLAPFLAVRNLDFDHLRKNLSQIFSNIAVNSSRSSEIEKIEAAISCIHEFDYVLIGPKIGIVVIEVKSSSFTKGKDFDAKNTHLPDDILKGINQLRSFDIFLNLLSSITGIEKPNVSQIRKILFLANLEKRRFDNWFENLSPHVKQNVGNILDSDGVNYWFQETGKIERLDESIPEKTYEIYGSIIAGIASMSILKNTNVVKVDELKLSESKNVEKVSQRVSSHDPVGKLEKTGTKRHNLEFSTAIVEHFSKSIILTPDQQRILNGPDRQFIIGAAGTGKTIILQEKALRLVSQGESVLVLVAKSYLEKFQKLLNDCESSVEKRFKVEEWGSTLDLNDPKFGKTLPITCKDMRKLQEMDMERFRKPFGSMLNYDHILIDDTFDSCDDMNKIVETIAFARIRDPPVKTFWMAFDYHYMYRKSRLWFKEADSVRNLIRSIALPEDPAYSCEWLNSTDQTSIHKTLEKFGDVDDTGFYYSASILSRVMRYPENIFKGIYEKEHTLDTYACFRPTPGHKIQGFHQSRHKMYKNVNEARTSISKRILHEIKKLKRAKVDMKDVVVVTNGVYLCIDYEACHTDIELTKYISEYLETSKNARSLGKAFSELQIIEWNGVSSLEWPIVIYAQCITTDLDHLFTSEAGVRKDVAEEWTNLGRYRARTRTTGKLIEVIAAVPMNWTYAFDETTCCQEIH